MRNNRTSLKKFKYSKKKNGITNTSTFTDDLLSLKSHLQKY